MLLICGLFLLLLYIYLAVRLPDVAFITCFACAGIVIAIAVYVSEFGLLFFAPLLVFLTLTVIVIEDRRRELDQWPQTWSKRLLTVLVPTGVLISSAFLGPIAFYFGVVLTFISVILISILTTSRLAITAEVVATLAACTRQNLPLAAAVEFAADKSKTPQSRTLRRISKWLTQGYSVSQAISRGYPKCPGYVTSVISAAESVNQLPDALQSLRRDLSEKFDRSRRIKPIHPIYPVILLIFIFLLISGLMYFVIPKFSEILRDFTVELPFATKLLLVIMHFLWDTMLVPTVLIAGSILAIIAVYVRFRPRRPQKPYILSRIGDFIKWHLPFTHFFEFNQSMVRVLEVIRLALRAGHTIDNAIALAASIDVNNAIHKRLIRWLASIQAGHNIADSARKCGLGKQLTWAMSDTVDLSNTLNLLEAVEHFYRTSYNYKLNLARFIFWPCLIIAIGIVVALVIYAIFIPMVTIISHLTNLYAV